MVAVVEAVSVVVAVGIAAEAVSVAVAVGTVAEEIVVFWFAACFAAAV